MNKPLDNIKVVELSTYVAAPATARILADFGAEVIKVESPSGDQWRETGRKMLNTTDDENPVWDLYNTGKKCICLNIKDPQDKERMLKLIECADIFITNTRAQSLKKLGLDAETLTEKFPRLIYAYIDGFGNKGPDANSPGFDNISFWARSGFCRDIPYQSNDYYPLSATSGVGDCVTGGFLLSGILMALYQRTFTGRGDVVNASLYGTAVWVMSSMLLRANPKYGEVFPPTPNASGDPLTNNYECADGEWVNISVRAYEKDAESIYETLGITDEIEGIGNVNVNTYFGMKEILIPIVRRAMKKKTASEWINEFRKKDLVIGLLPHMKDVLTDEQVWANGFMEEIVNRNGSKTPISCPPIRLESFKKDSAVVAPLLDENKAEILELIK